MTHTEGRAPETVQRYFQYADFPTDKDHLIQAARMNGAPPEVVEEILRLPDLRLGSPQDVVAAYERLR